jgi:hypothetical protein
MSRLDPASGAPPIYLCTMDELVGDADDERATAQLALLGAILEKLGYRLISGEAPNFHELWAAHVGTVQ